MLTGRAVYTKKIMACLSDLRVTGIVVPRGSTSVTPYCDALRAGGGWEREVVDAHVLVAGAFPGVDV